MFKFRTRRDNLIVATLFATVILTSTAAPAWAADEGDGDFCWMPVETGITQCFADEDAMEADIVGDTGRVLVQPGAVQARGVTALAASVTIAKLYENPSYGGGYITVVAPSTTFCTTNSLGITPMPSGWNDRVSSVKSYHGCQTRLFENIGLIGPAVTYTNSATLGSMDNETSSYRVF